MLRSAPSCLFHMFFVFLVLSSMSSIAQSTTRNMTKEEYVEKYKDLAISNMYEFGIPASIKLAQGILESGHGNSQLAREAHNHFGIKCHDWNGEKLYYDDDAPQECFRKYNSAEQSYKDHSIFLTTRPRYDFLFDLETTDYIGWSRGLKKAGYATNPRYADLLIRLIEDLELYQYDVPRKKIRPGKSYHSRSQGNAGERESDTLTLETRHKIFTNNGCKYIIAQEGDDFNSIAHEFNIYPFQIWKYNELSKKDKLSEGEMVYIVRKKGKGTEAFHVTKTGDNMRTISQIYGIRLSKLYRLNRMQKGEEPFPGQVIWLQMKKPIE